MKLGDMQVARSERVKVEPRKFPTHASNRTGGPPKMALPVNRSKRGPETSSAAALGRGPVKRYLFNPGRETKP